MWLQITNRSHNVGYYKTVFLNTQIRIIKKLIDRYLISIFYEISLKNTLNETPQWKKDDFIWKMKVFTATGYTPLKVVYKKI